MRLRDCHKTLRVRSVAASADREDSTLVRQDEATQPWGLLSGRLIRYFCIGSISFAVVAVHAGPDPVSGRFEGTGRACYGTLTIQPKTISWLTPFSQCKSMSYALISQDKQNGQSRMTYRLTSHAQSCRYAVLSLTHAGPAENTGWEVTGYGSEKSYLTDKSGGYTAKADDLMSCYLVRNQ
jgi:hypothetical protein